MLFARKKNAYITQNKLFQDGCVQLQWFIQGQHMKTTVYPAIYLYIGILLLMKMIILHKIKFCTGINQFSLYLLYIQVFTNVFMTLIHCIQ